MRSRASAKTGALHFSSLPYSNPSRSTSFSHLPSQSPPPQSIQNLLRRRLGPDHRVNSPVRRQRLPGLGPPTLLPSDSTPSSTPTNSGTPPPIPQSSTVPPDRRGAGETLPLPEMRVAANISSDHRRNRSLQIRPLGAPRLFSLNSRDFFLSICLVFRELDFFFNIIYLLK